MNDKIKIILTDLYELDPTLKNQEPELIRIVEKFLASRPDSQLDENFYQELRAELLSKARAMESERKITTNWWQKLFNTRWSYAVAGAILTLIIVIPITTNKQGTKWLSTETKFGWQLETIVDQGFGSLINNNATDKQAIADLAPMASQDNLSFAKATGLGGGGGMMNRAESTIMPPWQSIDYKYVYQGGELLQDKEQLAVLRRKTDLSNNGQLTGVLNSLNLGLLDLKTFNNLSLDNIALVSKGDYGYYFNINLNQGTITINQNWETWPMNKCRDEKCNEAYRINDLSEMPNDETLIEIANKFLKDHKISTDKYGMSEVINDWQMAYEKTTDQAMAYLPDALTVVYPLIINGLNVYESSGGNKYGITVIVNTKLKRVVTVSEISALKFEASNYAAETDTDKILKLAKEGGLPRQFYYQGEASEIKEIILGQGELAYVRYFRYRDGKNEELLVPAMIFPVTKVPDELLYTQQYITVPLIEEIINEFDGASPEPMPLLEKRTLNNTPSTEIESEVLIKN